MQSYRAAAQPNPAPLLHLQAVNSIEMHIKSCAVSRICQQENLNSPLMWPWPWWLLQEERWQMLLGVCTQEKTQESMQYHEGFLQ